MPLQKRPGRPQPWPGNICQSDSVNHPGVRRVNFGACLAPDLGLRRMVSADVRDKVLVAVPSEVLFHCFERLSVGQASRVEDPSALRNIPSHQNLAGLSIPNRAALRHYTTPLLYPPVSQRVSNTGQINYLTTALITTS